MLKKWEALEISESSKWTLELQVMTYLWGEMDTDEMSFFTLNNELKNAQIVEILALDWGV